MFDTGKETYKSDIKLGEKYQDKTTELIGHCVAIHFYEHACERVTLRYVDNDKNVREISFDAPELVHVESGKQAKAEKTGGPERATGARTF